IDRRTFLATGAAGVMGTRSLLNAQSTSSRVMGANDRVRIGVLGTGRQGTSDLRAHMALADFDIVAICDVYKPNLERAASVARTAEQYGDFRRVLDRKDVDAVIVGAPDHWHPLMTVMACQAGKDVYVEKPTSVA